MDELEIEKADFDELLTKLRKRGVYWTTWKFQGNKVKYTGRRDKKYKIISQEIKSLGEKISV